LRLPGRGASDQALEFVAQIVEENAAPMTFRMFLSVV